MTDTITLAKPPDRAADGEPMAWLKEQVATQTDDCQLWPFRARWDFGYGMVRYHAKARRAHHVAMLLAGLELPVKPLEVRHSCGHTGCVNVRHLVVGTHAENESDKVEHGTSNRGERQGSAKLSEADVRAIRQARGTNTDIARQFGVTQPAVSMIRSHKRWGHLQ